MHLQNRYKPGAHSTAQTFRHLHKYTANFIMRSNHIWDPYFSPLLCLSSCPRLRSKPMWPSSILTSVFMKWAQGWKNEQDLGEKLRAAWRIRQNANASMTKGITCQGKAKKKRYYAPLFLTHLLSHNSFSLYLYISISISFIVPLHYFFQIFFYCWISKMTAHKTPWNKSSQSAH